MAKTEFKYKLIDVPFQADFKNEINTEITNGREINALLLIHGYIEAYLLEWIHISAGKQKINLTKTMLDQIDHISFANILLINLMLSNIDEKLYKKIQAINNTRNKIAHDLIKIDLNDLKNKGKFAKTAKMACLVCEEIAKLYKQAANKVQKTLSP